MTAGRWRRWRPVVGAVRLLASVGLVVATYQQGAVGEAPRILTVHWRRRASCPGCDRSGGAS